MAVQVEVLSSTGFLERFLPLCMCLSQYLESGYASFEHLHFLPSVLLHLPGSGSIFLPKPTWKQFHSTEKIYTKKFQSENWKKIKSVRLTTQFKISTELERGCTMLMLMCKVLCCWGRRSVKVVASLYCEEEIRRDGDAWDHVLED